MQKEEQVMMLRELADLRCEVVCADPASMGFSLERAPDCSTKHSLRHLVSI